MADPKFPMGAAAKPTGPKPSAAGPKEQYDQPFGEGSDPGTTAFSDKDIQAVTGTRPTEKEKRDADWSQNNAHMFPGTSRPID